MKTSVRRRLLGGAIALTLVAAALGSDDDSSDSTEAPAEEATTTAGGAETTAVGRHGQRPVAGVRPAGGSVVVSGSSTVEPISIIVGEKFKEANPDAA